MAFPDSGGFDYWQGGRPATATGRSPSGDFDYWHGGRPLPLQSENVPQSIALAVAAVTVVAVVPAISASAVSLALPVAVVTVAALAPAISADAVSLAVPAAAMLLAAVAPAVTLGAVSLALGIGVIRVLAVAPSVTVGGVVEDGVVLNMAVLRRRRRAGQRDAWLMMGRLLGLQGAR